MSQDFLLQEWHDVGLKSDSAKTNDSGLGLESSAGGARLSDIKEEVPLPNKTFVPTVRTLNRPKSRTHSSKGAVTLKSNGNLVINSTNNMTTSEAAKLLDISSDSSESDLNLEVNPPKRKVRFKRKFRAPSRNSKAKVPNTQDSSSCSSCQCSNSLAFFGFLVLAICSVAQIYFHYNLSSRVDEIQKQYNAMEAQSKETPEALHDYHIQLKNLEFNVTTFAEELKKINSEMVTVNEAVRQLKSTTTSLKESIAAAPTIKTMPKDIAGIMESVATLGSKINQLDSNMKELKGSQTGFKDTTDTLMKTQEELKENVSGLLQMKEDITLHKDILSTSELTLKDRLTAYVHKEVLQLQDMVEEMNFTFTPKINNLTEWGNQIAEMNETLNWVMTDINSLHAFVYSNITSMIKQVQNEGGSSSPAIIEQTVLKMLTDALVKTETNQNTKDWRYLLREANKMVSIYVDIVNQLSNVSGTIPAEFQNVSNATTVVEKLVNGMINNCSQISQSVDSLNGTIHDLQVKDGESITFQTSINHTLDQLVNRMNSFSIQLASIKNSLQISSQTSRDNERSDLDTTSNTPPMTTTSIDRLATKPVPRQNKAKNLNIQNKDGMETRESVLKRALGGF